MTDAEHRAAEARRLQDEPLLTEALARMERDAVDLLVSLPETANEERWMASREIKVIRGFRQALSSAILGGQDQTRKRPAVA